MAPKWRGWGYIPLCSIIGGFLILKPLLEYFLTGSEEHVRQRTNVTVLLLSGVITLLFVRHSDQRNGVQSFAIRTWTKELGESFDYTFYVPTRLVGVTLVVIALVLDAAM